MNFKTLLFYLSTFFCSTTLSGQPPLLWAKQLSSNQVAGKNVVAVKSDVFGNFYLLGKFHDTLDFDPGPGVFNMVGTPVSISPGAYILKLDALGNFLWAREIETLNGASIRPMALLVDSLYNVYVGGSFNGTIDFNPSASVFSLQSGNSGFILKLDPSGNFIYADEFKGTCSIDALTTDAIQNIYATGVFSGMVDFDPGTSTAFVSSTYMNGTTYNSFALKVNPSGQFKWINPVKGPGSNGFCVDESGGTLYVGGFSQASSDFNPGAGVISNSFWAGYVWVMDTTGNVSATHFLDGMVEVTSLYFSNGIYLAATYLYSCDVSPGSAVTTLTANNNSHNIFFLKLNSQGNLDWVQHIPCQQTTNANWPLLQKDKAGNIGLSAMISGSIDFDPGPGSHFTGANTTSDFHFAYANYDSLGNYQWAYDIGPVFYPDGYQAPMAVTDAGDVYCAGAFDSNIDVDPLSTQHILGSPAHTSVYMTRLSYCKIVGSPTVSIYSPVNVLCKGDSVSLFASGGYSYLWHHNAAVANPLVVAPSVTTHYTVTGINLNQCPSTALITVQVGDCTGIKEFGQTGQTPYPNPVTESVYIPAEVGMEIIITDHIGRPLKSSLVSENPQQVNLREFAAGTYMAQIRSEGILLKTHKIIRQ